MKTLKDHLKQVRKDLRKQSKHDLFARIDAAKRRDEAIVEDEWLAFTTNVVPLKRK
jgi:hypothetical protein